MRNWRLSEALSLLWKPTTRGALLSVVLMGLGAVVGYAIQIFISRTLGAQEYGTYSYVLGLLSIGRTLVMVSFDIAAVRYVGVYHSNHDWAHFRGFIRTSRGIVVLLSAFGTGLSALVVAFLQPALLQALIAGCIILIPLSLLSLEAAFLQALRRVYESRVPNVFVRPLLLAGFLYFAIYGFDQPATAVTALYANAGGLTVALIISFWLMQNLLPEAARKVAPAHRMREWSAFCAVNVGQSLVYLLLSHQSDVVIVGSMIGTKAAGFYAAASQIATLMLLGVSTVNQYAAPMIAEFNNKRSDVGLRVLLLRLMILNAALSLPLIFGIIALGPMLLQTFGPAFVAAYPVIVILSAGCLVNALWGALWGDLLTMTGFQNESAVVIVTVTAVNLALTVLLTPWLGIAGAAIATTAAVILRSALLAVIVRIRLGFWPWTVWRHLSPT